MISSSKHISYKFVGFCLLFLISVISLHGQGIEGKWFNLKRINVYSDPNTYIMVIEDNNIKHYDFTDFLFVEKHNIRDSLIYSNDTLRYRLVEIENDMMNLDFLSAEDEEVFLSEKFRRFHPTAIEHPLHLVRNYSFSMMIDEREVVVQFTKILEESSIIQLSNGETISSFGLEQFDGTYFLLLFFENYIQRAYPIKSITSEKIILYNSNPEKPMKLMEATRYGVEALKENPR